MRKLFFSLLILTGILSLTGCGMKECECQAFDKLYYKNIVDSIIVIDYFTNDADTIYFNDIIDPRSDSVYTVLNFTRTEDCEQFNEDDTIVMDSVTYIHHKVICQEN